MSSAGLSRTRGGSVPDVTGLFQRKLPEPEKVPGVVAIQFGLPPAGVEELVCRDLGLCSILRESNQLVSAEMD
jgi:hypothetical protein